MRPTTGLLAILLVLALGLGAQAQVDFKQIRDNGPRSNRVNLVILADGYTSAQAGRFDSDAAGMVNYLFTKAPFSNYAAYYNVFTIFVPSVDSGADHPFTGIYKNTYFSASFDCYGIQRLITIPPNDWDGDYSHGAGKVYALLATYLPEYDIVTVLSNDPEYGGSGGNIAVLSNHSAAPEVIVHELGHTLADLGDEYEDAFPGYPDIEEPNTTMQTVRELIKWNHWILPTTPIPTPENSGYSGVVGLFEGAHYHSTGWYRPRLSCEMRSLNQNFCEVCKEQLVLANYRLVSPIDGYAPSSSGVTLTAIDTGFFSVTPLRPGGVPLARQWYVDSIPVSGANDTIFRPTGASIGLGSHRVQVKVWDSPSMVRLESSYLSRWRGWTVTVSSCCTGSTGNLDGDAGDFTDISDLSVLVDFLFSGGTISSCPEENNVDGVGSVDISDLTRLVDYLFMGIWLPVCP